MRNGKLILVMLAMGGLTFGAGLALAAAPSPKGPEAAKTSAVAPSAAAGVEKEATETKAIQKREATQAARERGERETAIDRIVRGDVTAVVPGAKTLVVQAMLGGESATIGVEVPPATRISAGNAAKTLADIKVGDTVWMRYDRLSNKLVADQIRIEKSAATTATAETPGMNS